MPIYDRSYRRWDGKLLRGSARWLPITASGIVLAFRARAKPARTVAFYVFLFASLAPFVIVLLINYFMNLPAEKLASLPPELVEDLLDLVSLKRAQYPFLVAHRPQLFQVILTLLFGAHLIARDRATMAIPLYLSRPLTRLDYLLGKFGVIAFFLLCYTLFPCLLIWVVDVAGSTQPGALRLALPQLGGIVGLCGTIVVTYSTTILAASSLCKRPMTAGLIWMGWILMTELFLAQVLRLVLDAPVALALSVQRCFSTLAYALFRLGELEDHPLGSQLLVFLRADDELPLVFAGLSLALHVGGALLVLRRMLHAEEVVQGS